MEIDLIWISLGITVAGYFMGISKEAAKHLIRDYPEIPHVLINETVYYPQGKLRKWLKDLGE